MKDRRNYFAAYNAGRPKKVHTHPCVICGKDVEKKGSPFCSSTCSYEQRRRDLFAKYDLTENLSTVEGFQGRSAKAYLVGKRGERCENCGWCDRNPVTGRVPIDLDHVDGNSENWHISNLRLICPNCHSLTPTYKSLNRGKGRHSRKVRYQEGKSY